MCQCCRELIRSNDTANQVVHPLNSSGENTPNMEGDNINVNEIFLIFIIHGGNVLLYICSTILLTNFYSVIVIYKTCFEKIKQQNLIQKIIPDTNGIMFTVYQIILCMVSYTQSMCVDRMLIKTGIDGNMNLYNLNDTVMHHNMKC